MAVTYTNLVVGQGSFPYNLSTTPPAGVRLVAAVAHTDGQTYAISDSLGGNWDLLVDTDGTESEVYIWMRTTLTTGATFTVTMTNSGGTGSRHIGYLSGDNGNYSVVKHNHGTSTVTAVDTNKSSRSGDLFLSIIGASGGTRTGFTAGSGWTAVTFSVSGATNPIGIQKQSAASARQSVSSTATFTGGTAPTSTINSTIVFYDAASSAGLPGTSYVAELNRLANGGTYPARTAYLDENGAANKLAGTTGLAATGALNIYEGLTIDKWQDFQGICNVIAGTTGLAAPAALRSINL